METGTQNENTEKGRAMSFSKKVTATVTFNISVPVWCSGTRTDRCSGRDGCPWAQGSECGIKSALNVCEFDNFEIRVPKTLAGNNGE